jgi:hypothetical protein
MTLGAAVRSLLILFLLLSLCSGSSRNPAQPLAQPSQSFNLDLSGLSWVEGNTFLAVHDSKNPEENDRPRLSLIRLPESAIGIVWKTFSIEWPAPLGLSSDLESVARIPGTNSFLLVESGEGVNAGQRYRRAFQIKVENYKPVLESHATLSGAFKNIEGSAILKVGNRLIFICAERADHKPRAEVFWADLQLNPLTFGKFKTAYFEPIGFSGKDKRPVTALETDSRGRLYVASAYDPDDDNGPFKSVIWRLGRFHIETRAGVEIVLRARVHKLATLDGLKVESLAIRESKGAIELFAGTDDENYGSALRVIPLEPL